MLSPSRKTFCRSFKLSSAFCPMPKDGAQQLASPCHSALFVELLVVLLRDLATQLTVGELRQRRCALSVKSSEFLRMLPNLFGLSALSSNFTISRGSFVLLAPRGLQYILVYWILPSPKLAGRK